MLDEALGHSFSHRKLKYLILVFLFLLQRFPNALLSCGDLALCCAEEQALFHFALRAEASHFHLRRIEKLQEDWLVESGTHLINQLCRQVCDFLAQLLIVDIHCVGPHN